LQVAEENEIQKEKGFQGLCLPGAVRLADPGVKRMSTPNTAMEIPAKLVKELRDRTNAGFNDCRAALIEAGGDIEKAIAVLRKKGQAAAAKKATREATEGLVGSYIHAGGKIGVLVEVNCESDFVARTEAFQHLCHNIAMHVAALDPKYVRREEVTTEMLEKEREIYRAQALATGKPENVVEKIVTGKMEKFYEENCLEEQHYIKDEGVTIKEMVNSAIAKLGENISIKRFARFKVGEIKGTSGLETAQASAQVKA
jgi:elongation factor Ts